MFRALDKKSDREPIKRACEAALAAAASDDTILDELVRLRLGLDDRNRNFGGATRDGIYELEEGLGDLVEERLAAGGAQTDACRLYARQQKTKKANDWAYEHSADDHADEVVDRLAARDESAPVIVAYWRASRYARGVDDAIRVAVAKRSTKKAAWPEVLRELASKLRWTDEDMAALHDSDRAHLVAVRRADKEAEAASRKAAADMSQRNADQLRKVLGR